jgi:hypothetical protein
MLRMVTSWLWLIAALALGFEAVAQPCHLATEYGAQVGHDVMSDMPCHDDMMMATDTNEPPSDHDTQTCCCAALLGNGMTIAMPTLSQPLPGPTLWVISMPDDAKSILLEFEPPPPRA